MLSDAHLRCCLVLQTTTPHTADTVLTRAVAVTTPTSTAHSEAAPPWPSPQLEIRFSSIHCEWNHVVMSR